MQNNTKDSRLAKFVAMNKQYHKFDSKYYIICQIYKNMKYNFCSNSWNIFIQTWKPVLTLNFVFNRSYRFEVISRSLGVWDLEIEMKFRE